MKTPFFLGMDRVAENVRQAAHVLLALDYDGTLTPNVDDPTDAQLSPATRTLLGELARLEQVDVAIVSGRSLADLKKMVGIESVICSGNHGLEIVGPSLKFLEPAAQASAFVLREIAVALADKLRYIGGAIVQDKGLTLSIDHRRVSPVDVQEVWRTVLRAVEPVSDRFHVKHGSKVHEVRPLVRWDNGAAVTWIKGQLGKENSLVVYIGDDATDEDAFTMLGANAVTIKVGDSAATTAARYLLSTPVDVHAFLHWVCELLKEKKGDV